MRGSAAFRVAVAPGGALAGPWVRDPLWTAARAVPSLDLRFADNKSLVDAVTGQNLVTFTRASSGTFVGSDGLIKSAVTNLQTNSENFASLGSLTGSTVSSNTTTAPNNQTTADSLIEDTSTGAHSVSGLSTAWVGNTTYTCSVYAKANTRSYLVLAFGTSSNWVNGQRQAVFNLSNGTIFSQAGSPVVASIQALPDGWYRCVMTATTVAAPVPSSPQFQMHDGTSASYTGNGTSGLFLWGAQLEQSTIVGEYIPTTSTINSAPRFDHNPTTGESLGLLVEEQRTNSIRNNTGVGAVAGTPGTLPTNWANNSAAGVTFSVVETGTEKGITYVDLKAVAASAPPEISFRFEANAQTAAASGQSWTTSTYVKVQAGSLVNIIAVAQRVREFNSGGTQVQVTSQDLAVDTTLRRFATTRTLSDATTVSVNSLLAITCTAGAAIDITLRIGLPQLEQGAFATSVIPTTTATVTRSADVASITGSNFSSWYRQDEGTVFGDYLERAFSQTHQVVSVSNGTTSERISMAINSSNVLDVGVISGGVDTFAGNTPTLTAQAYRIGFAYKSDSSGVSANGSAVTGDSAVILPTVSQLDVGARGSSQILNSTIRRLTYFPARLANEVLQSITQP